MQDEGPPMVLNGPEDLREYASLEDAEAEENDGPSCYVSLSYEQLLALREGKAIVADDGVTTIFVSFGW